MLSGDGTRVALALYHRPTPAKRDALELKVWDVNDGREVWHTAIEGSWEIMGLAIREDGGTVAASLIDVSDRRPERVATLRAPCLDRARRSRDDGLSETEAIYEGLAFRPDGARLAVIRRERQVEGPRRGAAIQILDASSGLKLRNIELPGADPPSELAYSPRREPARGLRRCRSALIRVWDAETGGPRFDLRGLPRGVAHAASAPTARD